MALIATHGGERWALPKGLVERGESVEETALREVREETGAQATTRASLEPIQYWFRAQQDGHAVRYHKKAIFYLMDYVSGDLADHDDEVDDARWFSIDEAIQRATYASEKRVIRQAVARLGLLCS